MPDYCKMLEQAAARMLTVTEASERSGIPYRTVRYYCQLGLLKSASINGEYRIDPSDLDKFVPPKRGRKPKTGRMKNGRKPAR